MFNYELILVIKGVLKQFFLLVFVYFLRVFSKWKAGCFFFFKFD